MQPTFLEFLDLELLKGFQGGFADGTYGYMVPQNNSARHCKVARISLQDFCTVAVVDLTTKDAAVKGFAGGLTDGTYGYVVTYSNGACHGKLARFSLQDFCTVAVLGLTITNAALKDVICETKL